MWCWCSSHVRLKIRILFKYTTTNELVNGRNMSSISLMKVSGEFFTPKGMTNHSNRPFLGLKAVFHTWDGSIGT